MSPQTNHTISTIAASECLSLAWFSLLVCISGCNAVEDAQFRARLADIAGVYHSTENTISGYNLLISAEGRYLNEVIESDAFGDQCGKIELCGESLCLLASGDRPCPFFLPQDDCVERLVVKMIDDNSIEVRAGSHRYIWERGRQCPVFPETTDGNGYNETVGPCDEQWIDESKWCEDF